MEIRSLPTGRGRPPVEAGAHPTAKKRPVGRFFHALDGESGPGLAAGVAGAALFPFTQVLHRAFGALAGTALGLGLLLLLTGAAPLVSIGVPLR